MTSRNSNAKIKFKGKSIVMKELQRTVSFRAYNDVVASGSSMPLKQLYAKAHQLYFGSPNNPDSIGYAEQMLKGVNAFSHMFDRSGGDEQDVLPAQGRAGGVVLTMKSHFHCRDDVITSNGPHKEHGINMDVLCYKSLTAKDHLEPRAIWDFGNLVDTNGKKALALVQASDFRDGKLRSGKNYGDYLFFYIPLCIKS